MPSQLQLRRGSTFAHGSFIGADGEVTFDTDTNTLVTHDGVTVGGFPHVTLTGNQVLTNKTLTAPTIDTPVISSPVLTGIPEAPTAAVNTSTTQVATTAFVNAEISNDAVLKTSNIGSAAIPSGTTAQRDVTPAIGYTRFNTTLNSPEVWNGTEWAPMGGGATGAPGNYVFVENDQTVTGDYTLTAGKNAGSFGPITINAGVTVTVPTGATWSIV